MRFQHIELHNVFSYREAHFDLSGSNQERNIALITGRNGYGKTSFINAIKLLFAGPNEDMRAAVQRDRKLTPKQYVEGVGEDWLGIFNRRARQEGDTQASIRILWTEALGEVEVTRSWKLGSTAPNGKIEITIHGEANDYKQNEDAQQFINERLPEAYLPFFFFDGEQIQRLAEANRSQLSRHIERLLNIAHIDILIEYVEKVRKQWQKSAMPDAARAQRSILEKEVAEITAKTLAAEEQKNLLLDEKNDLERIIQEENHYLESRQVANLAKDEANLLDKKRSLEADLERDQTFLMQILPASLPLLANPNLVKQTVEQLRHLVESESSHQADALQAILDDLPQDVFDKPPYSTPPLTDAQKRFYKHRLEKKLEAHIPAPEDIADGLFSLELSEARTLMQQLSPYVLAKASQREKAERLRSISSLKRQLAGVTARLEDISTLPPEEQNDYRRRKAANEQRLQRVGAIKATLEQLASQTRSLAKQEEAKTKEIERQEKAVRLSEQAQKKVQKAESTKAFFVAYKTELKKRKRQAVEDTLNHCFKELMTSHNLIQRIKVDEQFGLHFLDKSSQTFAAGSLSAGVTQLVATALIWALKEVSGKTVPLIIDTPLARIDLKHQQNLLTRYYPHASEQVIVLPTDSELDEKKYTLVKPHVYQEYRLENDGGDDTQLVESPMYDLEQKGV